MKKPTRNDRLLAVLGFVDGLHLVSQECLGKFREVPPSQVFTKSEGDDLAPCLGIIHWNFCISLHICRMPSVRHDLAEGEVLDGAEPFLFHQLRAGGHDDAVYLRLRGAVRRTAFTEKTLPDNIRHLVREFLLSRQDLFREVVLPARHRGLHLFFLVDRAEETAETALHALVRELFYLFKFFQIFHSQPPLWTTPRSCPDS